MWDFTLLPFNLKGKIYRSIMPFSDYDKRKDILQKYKDNNITLIVNLAEDHECIKYTNMNLNEFYMNKGFSVIPLPIKNLGVPEELCLKSAILRVFQCAQQGENIVIHCHAGIGRSGLFAACLAKEALKLTGVDAIVWTRKYISNAAETDDQEDMVLNYKACDNNLLTML